MLQFLDLLLQVGLQGVQDWVGTLALLSLHQSYAAESLGLLFLLVAAGLVILTAGRATATRMLALLFSLALLVLLLRARL